jgi:hypothetical protein
MSCVFVLLVHFQTAETHGSVQVSKREHTDNHTQAMPPVSHQQLATCEAAVPVDNQEQVAPKDTTKTTTVAQLQPSGMPGKPPKGPATTTAKVQSSPHPRQAPCKRSKRRRSASQLPRGLRQTVRALKAVATISRLNMAATHIAALQDAALCKVRLDMWTQNMGRSGVLCDIHDNPQNLQHLLVRHSQTLAGCLHIPRAAAGQSSC